MKKAKNTPGQGEEKESGRAGAAAAKAPRFFRAPEDVRASWEEACLRLREQEETERKIRAAIEVVGELSLACECRAEVERALEEAESEARTQVRLAEEECEELAGEWGDSEWYFSGP